MFLLGATAALISAASWACGTVIFERLGKEIPYIGLTFLKGLLSLLMMLLLALVWGGLHLVAWGDFLYLALSGVIGISLGDSLFFKSLQYLGAKVQVVFFLLGQIFTMLLSMALLGERLSNWQYFGSAILLLGIIAVSWGQQEEHPNKLAGFFYALLSILCFSSSFILIKVAIVDVDVVTASFYRMLFGTIFALFAGVALKEIPSWLKPLKNRQLATLFVFNTAIITYGGFVMSVAAVKYISVSLASVLSTTEPVFVLILTYLLNHEKVSLRELGGTALTVVGLTVIMTTAI